MALNQPLVSIGLPVYNGAKYLEEALESLLAQSFMDFEVIICDNGSTDDTQAICNRYQTYDPRIKYHRNSENLGAARNFNRTFELSQGKYFKWFAHDDRLHPDYLHRCVDAMEQASEPIVLCFPYVQYIDERGSPVSDERSLRIKQVRRHESYHGLSFSRLLRLSPACCPIFVFGLARASALRKTRLIGSYVMSDLIVVAELRLLGDFIEIPERLFFQRVYQREPTRITRNRVKGEAIWYNPANQHQRLLLPNAKLVLEYCRAIHQLGQGFTHKFMAYLSALGFISTTLKRNVSSRVWSFWSVLSVALVRTSVVTSIPIRLWCLLAALRYRDKDKLRVVFARPWHKTPFAVLLFGAQRLARRNDYRARSVLLDWLSSSHQVRRVAAAEAVAHTPEQYRQILRELGPEIAPEIDAILETAIHVQGKTNHNRWFHSWKT